MELRKAVIAVIASVLALSTGCLAIDCSITEADKHASHLLVFASPDFTVPMDLEGIARQCEAATGAFNNVQKYIKECTTGVAKSMGGLLMSNIEKLLNTQLCGNDEGKARFLKHAPCLHQHTPQIYTCVNNLTGTLEFSGKQKPDRHIDYGCCAANELVSCLKTSVKNCGEDTSNLVTEFTTGAMASLVDAVCVSYQEDPETCDELEPLDRTQKREYISVLPPLIQMGVNFLG